MPDYSDYIVFIDESGSPTISPVDPDYPIFVLIFCVVRKDKYTNSIQPAFKKLKFDFFGHDMTSLHSHAIRKPHGEYAFLHNADLREKFMGRVNDIMANADFELIVHIIDKISLAKKYSQPFDPYHIALRMNLEQLANYLRKRGERGKLLHLIAESRGRKEDRDLELEFRRIMDPNHDWGMADHFAVSEMNFSLRFAEKKINSAGLQMADLTGQPIGRHFLKPEQPNRAFDIIKNKVVGQIWKFPN